MQIGKAFVSGGVDGYVDLHAATGRLVGGVAKEGASLAADAAVTTYAYATNDQDMLAAPAYSTTMESQSRGTFGENAAGNLTNGAAGTFVAPYEATKDFIKAGVNSYETGDPMGDATVGFVTTTLPAVAGATALAEGGMQFAKNAVKGMVRAESSSLADAAGAMCFAGGTTVWTLAGPVPIEQVTIGQRVLASSEQTLDDTEVIPEDWRCFEVELIGAPERHGALQLLRPASWADDNRVVDERPGIWIKLSIPEWQLNGRVRVLAVTPCPEMTPGPGRIVFMKSKTRYTGVFADVRLNGSTQVLRGTWCHPILSATRNCFVSLGDLHAGERVRTADGWAIVKAVARSWGTQEVFNLEVDRDHQFLIGEFKIISHNAGPNPCSVAKIDPAQIKAPPSKPGNAPIGIDDKPIEIHHEGQLPDGTAKEMTVTDHRLGENQSKNHPNAGPSQIDRNSFNKWRRDYWKKELESGRFECH